MRNKWQKETILAPCKPPEISKLEMLRRDNWELNAEIVRYIGEIAWIRRIARLGLARFGVYSLFGAGGARRANRPGIGFWWGFTRPASEEIWSRSIRVPGYVDFRSVAVISGIGGLP